LLHGRPRSVRRDPGSLATLAYGYRVYLLLALICAVMSVLAPEFRTSGNVGNILKATALNLPAAAGFTLVLVCGQLDLSIGSVMTLGGMLAVGLQPHLGWAASFVVGVLCGALVGLLNGLLVARAKINSFIVTLGSMIVVQNAVIIYCRGGTIPARSFALADWFQAPVFWVVTPQVLIPFVVMGALAVFMSWTPVGRGYYLLGGNPQTAWFSGLRVDRYFIGGFVLSGMLSALGGALVSMGEGQGSPTLGLNTLMVVVAATIIGGTSMAGGRGSVVGTTVALLALAALIKGLNCLGAGFEMELMASGLVLAVVIVYDAWRVVQQERVRGQRRELVAEIQARLAERARQEEEDEERTEEDETMQSKDRTLALVCMTMVACVAIVGIVAMYLIHTRSAIAPAPMAAAPLPGPAHGAAPVQDDNLSVSLAVDVSGLKSSDTQPLLIVDDSPLKPPTRPTDPSKLPEEDALHWYDMEYAGWVCEKVSQPKSPADGARGKYVMCLRHMDHPYTAAYTRGMEQVAAAYGIRLKTLTAGNADVNIQSQQVDQCLTEKPDLVVLFPVDAKAVVPMFRKLNKAGIPVIASNLLPVDEGMKYVLTWSGPDDWGQFRMLAREFAKRLNYQGGYCVIRHMPGGSPFFSRTFAPVTELKKIAPKMKCLDMQTTMLEAEKTTQVVADWITKYGKELKGIVSADDSGAQIGINEACQNAKRDDIVRVAAGNSKVGMDFIKAGALHAVTYQSAEADGALPLRLAADWFNGKELTRAVYYLPKKVITKENVDQFMPAQW
jgi:ribose transport system substrate-binding protein